MGVLLFYDQRVQQILYTIGKYISALTYFIVGDSAVRFLCNLQIEYKLNGSPLRITQGRYRSRLQISSCSRASCRHYAPPVAVASGVSTTAFINGFVRLGA